MTIIINTGTLKITYGDVEIKKKSGGQFGQTPGPPSYSQRVGRFNTLMKTFFESFYTHETYELMTHLSRQKCPKTYVRPFGIQKIFPDPHKGGRV